MSKEQFDRIISKWISRKLLVFLIACGGLFTGFVPSSDWMIIATAYITGTLIEEKINKKQ